MGMFNRHNPALCVAENAFLDVQSGENVGRKREPALGDDPLVFFGGVLDAVARVAGITIRRGHEMTNSIATGCQQLEHGRLKLDELTDFEFMHDPVFLPSG